MVEPKDSGQITYSKIDKAITALKDLKPKERDSLSERVAVRKMRRYIEKLTSDKYGYTFDEVSEMLKGLGINLSGSRIKYLLGEVKKNTRRRHKKESSDSKSTTSESILSVTQPTQLNTASESINSVADSKPATSAKSKRKNQQQTAPQQPQAEL
jgi:hypothetical protein